MKTCFCRMWMALLLLLPAMPIAAKEVNPKKALEVATQFMNSRSALRSGTTLELVFTGKSGNTTLRSSEKPSYYVYNVKDGKGFVIIAGDDVATPVLGYSFSSSFKAEGMPVHLKSFLNRYDEQIRKGAEMGLETSAAWEDLRSDASASSKVLHTAKWNQDVPYNGECPMILNYYVEKTQSLAGCMATAIAILMEYHKYPASFAGGKFTYLSLCDRFFSINGYIVDNTQEITVDMNRSFDWNLMLDEYTAGQYSAAQGKEVAALMFCIGAATRMNYNLESSTNILNVYSAFYNHMQFPTAKLQRRSYMEDADFRRLLKQEIDANRPVLYGSNSGRHLFVCDGYDDLGNFHFNWGWSGNADGFFALDALTPLYYDFSQNAYIFYNLIPSTEERDSRAMYYYTSIFDELLGREEIKAGLYPGKDTQTIAAGVPFTVDMNAVMCDYAVDSSVVFAIAHTNRNGEIKEIVGQSGKKRFGMSIYEMEEFYMRYPSDEAFIAYVQANPEFISQSVVSDNIACEIKQPIEEGDRLILCSQSAGTQKWWPVYSYFVENK
ncbi:MAG: C10 family peptidase, partial [Parabacteroides sp.]|nr:C10 family peptidase [Parabacteroides sp.]